MKFLFQQLSFVKSAVDQIPHARPETPRNVTHTHDDDCSDEDSDCLKNT
jgi:5'-nucleotidase